MQHTQHVALGFGLTASLRADIVGNAEEHRDVIGVVFGEQTETSDDSKAAAFIDLATGLVELCLDGGEREVAGASLVSIKPES